MLLQHSVGAGSRMTDRLTREPLLPSSNKRGPTVIAGVGCHLLGYVMNRIFTEMPENLKGVKYFGVIWTQMYGTFPQPLNVAWVSVTCHDSEVRALAMAM